MVDMNLNFDYPMVVYDTTKHFYSLRNCELKPDVYVANLSKTDLKNFFRRMGNHTEYNPEATFIFLLDNITTVFEDELSRYFIPQTILLSSNRQCLMQDELIIFPQREDIKITVVETKQIEWNNSSLKTCFLDETLPPYSLYTLCPDCSPVGGLSFDVIDIILERLNIIRRDQILLGSDFSGENVKNWLSNGMCDIVFSPLITDGSLLDYIFPVNDDELIWFVPSPARIPKWRYLTKVFPVEVWLIWGITLAITFTVWITVEKIMTNKIEHRAYEYRRSSIMTINFTRKCYLFLRKVVITSKLFLEQSHKFNIKYLFQETLLITIILTTLTMNLIYKTRFTSLLLGPDIHENGIKTLEDIVDNEWFVSFAEWRSSAFDGTSSKVRYYFKAHNTECQTITTCLERMRVFKDLALLMSIEHVKYDYENYLDEDGGNIIEPIYPRFVKPLYGTITLRGHPVKRILTNGIDQLRDHGFLSLIISKYSSKYQKHEVPRDKKLTFDQLRGPFFILIFGVSTATLIFMLEVTLNHIRKKFPGQ
ncbi:hypothetical protein WA026_009748 [Henosepilachna vigintioctopunctata]|uniref:Ionotropic receptor n=1 Tax=Henosepilachna vigintioctopunctata TaxID=420089 RepID=A0AAW1TL78_9CUCU